MTLLKILILAATASRICATYSSLKSRLFSKLPLDDVVVMQDVLSDVTVVSDMDCARVCVDTEECVMFTTSRPDQTIPTGRCQLYRQKPNSATGQEDHPGARNYAVYDPCDDGYSWMCGRCLLLVSTKMTFSTARQHCQAQDRGRLMVIKTLEEMHCAMDFMDLNGVAGLAWVGAQEQEEEGRFVWEDGALLDNESALWTSHEPDAPNRMVCVSLSNKDTLGLGLHDNLCGTSRYFVCEKLP